MLELLRPWSAYIDVNCTSHTDSLDKNQIDRIMLIFSLVECNIGMIYRHGNGFSLAEDYFQRALSYARQYEGKGELKTDILCSALKPYMSFEEIKGIMMMRWFLSKKSIIVLLLLIIRSIRRYRRLPVRSSNVSSLRVILSMQRLLHS
jgi:hypothetical protein